MCYQDNPASTQMLQIIFSHLLVLILLGRLARLEEMYDCNALSCRALLLPGQGDEYTLRCRAQLWHRQPSSERWLRKIFVSNKGVHLDIDTASAALSDESFLCQMQNQLPPLRRPHSCQQDLPTISTIPRRGQKGLVL